MADEKEQFYVSISSSTDFRKDLLETTKSLIHLLQKYERYKNLRVEKIAEIYRLKEQVKELQTLNNKLKSELPQNRLRGLPAIPPRSEMPASDAPRMIKKDMPETSKNELRKLQDELNFIEGKLKELR